MEVELKLLSTGLLSVDRTALSLEQVEYWLAHYKEHQKLPLIYVSKYGRFARYRLRTGCEVVVAAETLRLDALWVLVLPAGPVPFDLEHVQSEAAGVLNEASIHSEAKEKIQQAQAFSDALASGLSQQAIATQYRVSRSYVNNTLQLAKLPKDIHHAFLMGQISSSQARILSYEKDAGRQRELLHWVSQETVSARALERAVYHKSDVPMERVVLSQLENRLSEHWQCPVQLKSQEGQGVLVTARPHIEQITQIMEGLRSMKALKDLTWKQNSKSQCVVLSFIIPSQGAFTQWVNQLGVSDASELGDLYVTE